MKKGFTLLELLITIAIIGILSTIIIAEIQNKKENTQKTLETYNN